MNVEHIWLYQSRSTSANLLLFAKNTVFKGSLFGSILRSDFNKESDVDVLVEFKPDRVPGLFKMVSMEMALAQFFENRKVDLRTAADLSRYFRDDVVASTRTLYECEN